MIILNSYKSVSVSDFVPGIRRGYMKTFKDEGDKMITTVSTPICFSVI